MKPRPVDLNVPEPGWYLVKLVKGGVDVPVLIARLCACTIGGGDENAEHEWRDDCDRYPPIRAWLGGEEVPTARVWPSAAKHRIGPDEYAYRMRVKAWAETYAPQAPEANPRQAVDLGQLPPLF